MPYIPSPVAARLRLQVTFLSNPREAAALWKGAEGAGVWGHVQDTQTPLSMPDAGGMLLSPSKPQARGWHEMGWRLGTENSQGAPGSGNPSSALYGALDPAVPRGYR